MKNLEVGTKVDFYEVVENEGRFELVKKSEILSDVSATEKAVTRYYAKRGRTVQVENVEKVVEKYKIDNEKFFAVAVKVEN